MMTGMLKAIAKGPSHIVSFSAVFSIAQSLGGLAGSALLGSFEIVREKYHSAHLVEAIRATDPLMADRLRALSGSYGRVLADPALRTTEGVALLGQQVTREATVLAYNDLFLLAAGVAAGLFIWLGVRWLYYRINHINPLAEDLAALQRLRQEQSR
jgi:hypothetical protein